MENMRSGICIYLLLICLCTCAYFIRIISCMSGIYRLVIMHNLLYIEGFSAISEGAAGFQVANS